MWLGARPTDRSGTLFVLTFLTYPLLASDLFQGMAIHPNTEAHALPVALSYLLAGFPPAEGVDIASPGVSTTARSKLP